MHWLHFAPGKGPLVPTGYEAGVASELVWTQAIGKIHINIEIAFIGNLQILGHESIGTLETCIIVIPLPANDSTVCHFLFRRVIMMDCTCSTDGGNGNSVKIKLEHFLEKQSLKKKEKTG
jgi:hypothetical protein